MAAAQAEARGRSLLRPFHRRPLPPRHQAIALAPRQGAEAVHAGAGEAEESGLDEAVEVMVARIAQRNAGPKPGFRFASSGATSYGPQLGGVPLSAKTSAAR